MRVASGQQIPDLTIKDGLEESRGIVVPVDKANEDGLSTDGASGKGDVSESEDVADRALRALQEMRSSAPSTNGDEIDVRRRRDGADEERKARRMRRRTAQQSTSSAARDSVQSPTDSQPDSRIGNLDGVNDEFSPTEDKRSSGTLSPVSMQPPPAIIVSPTPDDGDEEVNKQ